MPSISSRVRLRTGSVLEKQFDPLYLPRVFNVTLPYCVGGPDFPGISSRWKKEKKSGEDTEINLDAWTALMACRCEAQMRFDWDFMPGVWSLASASKVNLDMSLSMKRALRRGASADQNDQDIAAAAGKIYELLWTGEYEQNGRRLQVNGDISKLERIIGMTDTQRSLVRNMHLMSARIPGTRQIRNSIRHVVFASRVVYGVPVFVTITPSERHSGLAIHLFRGWRNDPAFACATQDEDAGESGRLDNSCFVPFFRLRIA